MTLIKLAIMSVSVSSSNLNESIGMNFCEAFERRSRKVVDNISRLLLYLMGDAA